MRNSKKLIEEEPVWKRRRREGRIKARRTKMWIALGCVLAAAVLAFFVFSYARGLGATRKKAQKPSPHHGIAQVVDKRVERLGSKTERVLIFHVGSGTARKVVDEATFDSMKKGQRVVLSYDANYLTGMPTKIYGWEPYKEAKPAGAK